MENDNDGRESSSENQSPSLGFRGESRESTLIGDIRDDSVIMATQDFGTQITSTEVFNTVDDLVQ